MYGYISLYIYIYTYIHTPLGAPSFPTCLAAGSYFRSSGMWCLRMWCLIIIDVTLSYKYMFPNMGSRNYYILKGR